MISNNIYWDLLQDCLKILIFFLQFSCIYFQSQVTMSESLLEDMILSLDSNFDNYLDYKELAEGLRMWKKERRENKRKMISREASLISQKSDTSNNIYF